MNKKITKEQAKEKVIDELDELKNKISEINAIAVEFELFPKTNPSRILDLSCACDDMIGELEE